MQTIKSIERIKSFSPEKKNVKSLKDKKKIDPKQMSIYFKTFMHKNEENKGFDSNINHKLESSTIGKFYIYFFRID